MAEPRSTTERRSVTAAPASRAAVWGLVASSTRAPSASVPPNRSWAAVGTAITRALAATSRASRPGSAPAARTSTTSPAERSPTTSASPMRTGVATRPPGRAPTAARPTTRTSVRTSPARTAETTVEPTSCSVLRIAPSGTASAGIRAMERSPRVRGRPPGRSRAAATTATVRGEGGASVSRASANAPASSTAASRRRCHVAVRTTLTSQRRTGSGVEGCCPATLDRAPAGLTGARTAASARRTHGGTGSRGPRSEVRRPSLPGGCGHGRHCERTPRVPPCASLLPLTPGPRRGR